MRIVKILADGTKEELGTVEQAQLIEAQLIAALAGKLDASEFETLPLKRVWTSQDLVIDVQVSVTHGIPDLDTEKAIFEVWIKCVVADAGEPVGRIWRSFAARGTGSAMPVIKQLTSTQASTRTHFQYPAAPLALTNTIGEQMNLTAANWRYVFKIYY